MEATLKKQLQINACKIRMGVIEGFSMQSRGTQEDHFQFPICYPTYILFN